MTEAVETPPPDTAQPVVPPDLAPKPRPETTPEPAPEPMPKLAPEPAPTSGLASKSIGPLLPWLAAAVILILAVAQAALWVRVLVPASGPNPLDQRVQAIEARVAVLEHRPASVAAGHPAPATATSTPPDLGPLEARIAALEQRPPAAAIPNTNDNLAPRLTADEARLATLEKTAGASAQLADRANRVARIQSALVALSAGRPLGELPGASPALARYATTAPPTEPALRLAFPAAAQAALAADHPAAGEPFLERVWAEAQDLVTIRQGDHVLIGDPAAGVLARVKSALDAGDLAGAAAAASILNRSAAQALAPWLGQVRELLAARAALADLATQT
jgi:hypothetical protein